jgi:transposase InsO family protein
VAYLRERLGYSRWRICRAIGQAWSSQRYEKKVDHDERCLVTAMRRLAVLWPRFGYRRITVLLVQEGWRVNAKRVHRLWKEEGLQIRKKQHKRRRMGSGVNACHRRRPRYKDHVWGYDFVSERTERGGQLKMLNVVDEFTRECLAIEVARKFTGQDVVAVLQELFDLRGRPRYLRSDNGPEFACKAVRKWLRQSGVGTLFIEPGSPWENGYVESFNGKLRDECLNGELFLNLVETRYVVDRWRLDYNHHRPHSMLNWQTPAAFAARCRGRRRSYAAPASPLRAQLPQHTLSVKALS